MSQTVGAASSSASSSRIVMVRVRPPPPADRRVTPRRSAARRAKAATSAARAPAARAVVWMDVPLRAFAAGGAGARSYPCRCGGAFEIFDDEPCADGDLVPCDGCSAHVRLVM